MHYINKLLKTVLVIEEDELTRSAITKFLTKRYYNVFAIDDGWMGIKLAHEYKPDLIFCSTNLGSINGFDILRRLRSTYLTARIPFIFIASEPDIEDRVLALQLGANGYMTKPVMFDDLCTAISSQFD